MADAPRSSPSPHGDEERAPAPRAPSLRLVLALTFGLLTLASVAALGLVLTRTATRALETEIGTRLVQDAAQMADKLDRGLYERWRDVQVAASLPLLGDQATPVDARRSVLETLKETFPAYAWLGLVARDGRVLASTGRVFEGGDASARPWWRAALEGPIAGDVHEAKLLASLLPPGPGGEPLRFVDLAAPVARAGAGGTRPGVVLAAHLSWEWADDLRRSLASPRGGGPGAETEILVLATDDTVLLGPPSLAWRKLDSTASAAAGAGSDGTWRVGTWPDGRAYLTAVSRTAGHRDYPGLGWRVLARTPVEEAFVPARALRRTHLAAGAATAALAGVLAWLAAGWVAAPLARLTLATDRLREAGRPERPWQGLPASARYREVAALSRALERLLRANDGQRRELEAGLREKTTLLQEIHHRVKNNLQLIISLLRLDMRGAEDRPEAAGRRLELAIGRIEAIGLVHKQLYEQPDLARIDLAWHLRELAAGLAAFGRSGGDGRPAVAITVDADPVRRDIETAVPLGLIVNELVANSLKHAFPGGRRGRVAVTLRRAAAGGGDGFRLTVTDDGVGGPAPGEATAPGVGRRLVAGLARQLRATLREEVTAGGRVVVLDVPPRPGDPHPSDGDGGLPPPA